MIYNSGPPAGYGMQGSAKQCAIAEEIPHGTRNDGPTRQILRGAQDRDDKLLG